MSPADRAHPEHVARHLCLTRLSLMYDVGEDLMLENPNVMLVVSTNTSQTPAVLVKNATKTNGYRTFYLTSPSGAAIDPCAVTQVIKVHVRRSPDTMTVFSVDVDLKGVPVKFQATYERSCDLSASVSVRVGDRSDSRVFEWMVAELGEGAFDSYKSLDRSVVSAWLFYKVAEKRDSLLEMSLSEGDIEAWAARQKHPGEHRGISCHLDHYRAGRLKTWGERQRYIEERGGFWGLWTVDFDVEAHAAALLERVVRDYFVDWMSTKDLGVMVKWTRDQLVDSGMHASFTRPAFRRFVQDRLPWANVLAVRANAISCRWPVPIRFVVQAGDDES